MLLRKSETLTRWTLLDTFCLQFWVWLLLYSAITPKNEDKKCPKVFNVPEFHFSEVTFFQNWYFRRNRIYQNIKSSQELTVLIYLMCLYSSRQTDIWSIPKHIIRMHPCILICYIPRTYSNFSCQIDACAVEQTNESALV